MRRLLPDVAETTLDEQIESLELSDLAPADRPYTITNFALTVDGRATLEGRSGKIGTDVDTAMLVGLRSRTDALMIGAGTMKAERYGSLVPKAEKRERRERAGLRPEPLAVLVSGRLGLPWDAGLFTSGEGEIVIFTQSPADIPETATPVHVERHPDAVDLSEAMRYLRQERGVRSLLCEGGPRLHAQLIEAGLVDELFVTHAPKLAGGEGPGLVTGLPEKERRLEYAWLLEEDGELFARYRLPARV
jgi:riboflavin-specific deaminase-like protein